MSRKYPHRSAIVLATAMTASCTSVPADPCTGLRPSDTAGFGNGRASLHEVARLWANTSILLSGSCRLGDAPHA